MKRKPSPKSSSDEASYEVGYGKPPKRTRFKPGQCGNPKGRPRGRRNLRTVIRNALEEMVPIREGDRRRSVPRMDAIIRVAFNNALKGDAKAIAAVIQLARSVGLMDEELELSSTQSINVEDAALLAGFLERNGVKPQTVDGEDEPAKVEASRTVPVADPEDKA